MLSKGDRVKALRNKELKEGKLGPSQSTRRGCPARQTRRNNISLMKIGILALQGSFEEHAKALAELGKEPVFVRYPEQLAEISGLIIPGGESTTMERLAKHLGLDEALREWQGAIMGTCAGLILLAQEVEGQGPGLFAKLPVKVRRNAWGRQVESFEAELRLSFDEEPFRGVFIRAPRIVDPGEAEVVAWLGEEPVGVKHGRVLGLAFHPELTDDLRFHRWLVELAEEVEK